MLAIVDNDVAGKLARFGLVSAFESLMRREHRKISLQPHIDATFDLKKLAPITKLGPGKFATEAQRDTLADFAKRCGRIKLDVDCGQKLVTYCALVDGIDSGDAVWLSVAACDAHSVLFTHDKTALTAAANTPSCKPIADRLSGRVYCFEQLIVWLIDDLGFHVVRKAVLSDPATDGAIVGAFAGDGVTQASAKTSLGNRIQALRLKTGALLAP